MVGCLCEDLSWVDFTQEFESWQSCNIPVTCLKHGTTEVAQVDFFVSPLTRNVSSFASLGQRRFETLWLKASQPERFFAKMSLSGPWVLENWKFVASLLLELKQESD